MKTAPATIAPYLRVLAINLAHCGLIVDESEILTWPPWKVRASYMWIMLVVEGRIVPSAPDDFALFMARRSGLRSCRVCGCTEDFACPGLRGKGCSWFEADLCSECWGVEL
jgi:hypothetical protein